MKIPKALKSGKADKVGLKPKDVDKKQLRMGTKVEQEHTKHKEIAQKIAMDHLTEIEDYYSRLAKMEQSAPHTEHPQIKTN